MANSNQKVETPTNFYEALIKFIGIDPLYDMAADKKNSKCLVHFNEQEDSLSIDWPTTDWLFLNPPYRNLTQWTKKCTEQMKHGARILTIWPLSCDQNQITTFKNCQVTLIHGRVWGEVRGIMACVWDKTRRPSITGARWDGSTIKKIWGTRR